MNKILVVEDERPISDLIVMSLTGAGYCCQRAFDGIQAADMIEHNAYDLILLDIMLPGYDGYELMNYIRPLEIPVIFLTAKASVDDRVRGLKAGADDYLPKPFEIVELLARVESVLRRYHKQDAILTVGDVQVDTLSRTVKKKGKPVSLTKKEFDLLLLFMQNPGIALFREKIYERIWEGEYMGDSRTIDLHVQRLRKKIGWEDRLVAVYKVGYRLEN
nr:response regulator transcription factor [bacterium]